MTKFDIDPAAIEHVSASELAIFAINTGKWYELHKAMARRKGASWILHVAATVMPAYRKEFHSPRARMLISQQVECARQLREYYEQHVKELDACAHTTADTASRIAQVEGDPC